MYPPTPQPLLDLQSYVSYSFSVLLSLSLSASMFTELGLPLSTILICLECIGRETDRESEDANPTNGDRDKDREARIAAGKGAISGPQKVALIVQHLQAVSQSGADMTTTTTRLVTNLADAWDDFATCLATALAKGKRALTNRRLRSPIARAAAALGKAVDDFVGLLDDLGIEQATRPGAALSVRSIVGRSTRSRRTSAVGGGAEDGLGGGSGTLTAFLPIAAVAEVVEEDSRGRSDHDYRTSSRSEQLFGVGTVSIPVPVLLARLSDESRRPPSPTEAALLEHALDPYSTGQVSPVSFDDFLLGFGPLRHCIRNFLAVLRAPWFGGHLTRREADLLLAGADPGTFLVRFHRADDAYFDAATVMEDGQVRHIHVAASTDGGDGGRFSVRADDGTARRFSSLPRLVDEHSNVLRVPLPSPLTNEPWFHGDLSSDDAAELLAGKAVGTYLVRFSGSTPGTFAISWLATPETVSHVRFSRSVVSRQGTDVVYEYTVAGETLRAFASVSMLLDSYSFLSDPLPNPQATMNSLMRSLRSRKMSRRHSSSSRKGSSSRRESRSSRRSPSPDSRSRSEANSRTTSPSATTAVVNPLRLPSVGEISPRTAAEPSRASLAAATTATAAATSPPQGEAVEAGTGTSTSTSTSTSASASVSAAAAPSPRLPRLLRRGSKVSSKSSRFEAKAASTAAAATGGGGDTPVSAVPSLEEGGSLRNKARSLLRMKKRSSLTATARQPPAPPASDPWSAAASAGRRGADVVPQPTVRPTGAWPLSLFGATSSVRFSARPIDDATLASLLTLAAPSNADGAAGAATAGELSARNQLLADFWVAGERELSATLQSLATEASASLAPLADASLVKTIFDPVRELAAAHTALLGDRLAAAEADLAAHPTSDASVRAAPLLINIVSFVEDPLLSFCRRLPHILVAMDELARTPGAADAAVSAAAVVAGAAGLTTVPSLFALLLAPVSRAYRYPDELRSLRSLTPPPHADHAFLDTCIVDSSHAAGAIGTIHAEASAVQQVLDAVDNVVGGRDTMLSQGGTDRLVRRRLELTEPMVAVPSRASIRFLLFSDCVWVVDADQRRILGTAPREAITGRFERPGELVLAHRFQGGSEWMRLVCTEAEAEMRIRAKLSM